MDITAEIIILITGVLFVLATMRFRQPRNLTISEEVAIGVVYIHRLIVLLDLSNVGIVLKHLYFMNLAVWTVAAGLAVYAFLYFLFKPIN